MPYAPLRAACYVRVSTEEQKKYGISVDAQIAALQTYCTDHGYRVAGIYNDAGISARKSYTGRPALGRLIQSCQAGDIDIILFTKLDRWTRSVGDYYEIERQLNEVPWVAIQEDYETQTPSGRFKVNIMLSVAQNEADITSARIKAAFDYKRAKGEPVTGAIPLGYIIKDKHIAFDPEFYEGMNAFFREYLETFSAERAVEAARNYGVNMGAGVACRRLRNKMYRGISNFGPVPAYITEEEGEIIDRNMDRNSRRTKDNARTYIFSGLVYCGKCGCRLPGRSKMPRKSRQDMMGKLPTRYYMCLKKMYKDGPVNGCTGIYQNEDKLEKHLVGNLMYYMEQYNIAVRENHKHETDHTAEIKRLEQKEARIRELYIDGDISRPEYQKRKNAIEEKIKILKQVHRLPLAELNLPEGWETMYWGLDADAKRVFWRKLIRKITVYENHRIEVEF